MTETWPRNGDSLTPSLLEQITQGCRRFEAAWTSGQRPRIEEYLQQVAPPGRSALLKRLLALEIHCRKRIGEIPAPQQYRSRFPEHGELIALIFDEATAPTSFSDTQSWADPDSRPRPFGGSLEQTTTDGRSRGIPPELLPVTIAARYELRRILGQGGFGTVYLGHDADLDRPVAVKLLDSRWLSSANAVEKLRGEARTLARLQHPAIVAVHDVGTDEAGRCYMVMNYIEGRCLKDWMNSQRPTPGQAASAIATIAEAVHYAHTQELVHRDLKPSNILMDTKDRLYVVDFGLAVHDDTQHWLEGEIGGTAAYMAPEQVRGESHRLDGRTDVWGLGVILYELLTGRRPFQGHDREQLFDEIRNREPKPPRQVDDTIPKELERVCLKCLSKRMTDRFTTAMDLANDLRGWAEAQQQPSGGGLEFGSSITRPQLSGGQPLAPSELWKLPAQVVPRGLRPFSSQDKSFFLYLLSGPRDQEGLPESLQFWKSRIEDAEPRFTCGLIYGPSGSGKSSFVRAGLLPQLAGHVVPVYVEAVPHATESRLLKELQKRCPQLADDLDLAQAFASLRAGKHARTDRKLLIVLDQFEQWLHSHRAEDDTGLIDALRQCDGQQIQCLIMVRDDFWLATTRVFAALEVRLVQGENLAVVDLFDPRHARKVLTDFGRAYECLPNDPGKLTAPQKVFLDQAVAGLLQDGKVVPVRLSLFAEMVKAKQWSAATLEQVGGMEGLGVAFLEESFGARTANPLHRLHQTAARAVLKALLPDHSADIKGRVRAHGELVEVSGYDHRPDDFQELLRILDTELRLITPTDPEGQQAADGDQPPAVRGEKYYQLSHDYLVRPLREWLTRKERETWRGRARLCLQQRTAQWKPSTEKRFLPSPLEYLRIRAAVPRKTQTADQREIIKAATKRYATMTLLVAALVAMLAWGAWEVNGRIQGRRLTQAILAAKASELAELIDKELVAYRRWADPELRRVAADESAEPEKRLRARLALARFEINGQTPQDIRRFLSNRLLDCSLDEFPVIRDRLAPYKTDLGPELSSVLHDAKTTAEARFRAGMALAAYAPRSAAWSDADVEFLAAELVKAHANHQPVLRGHLKPIAGKLLKPLEAIFRDENQSEALRVGASHALVDFASASPDPPALLAQLAADSTAYQYGVVYAALARQPADHEAAKNRLRQILQTPSGATDSAADRMREARSRAGAAVTLIRLGAPDDALPVFGGDEDREPATQFIHRLQPRGVTATELAACFDSARDASSRYSLLLALGAFSADAVEPSVRARLIRALLDRYRDDPDSSVHGACGWLLRKWGFRDEVANDDPMPQEPDPEGKRTWFVQRVGGESMTLVVYRPGSFMRGSPEAEEDHQRDEAQRLAQITRPLAICDREVTRRQFEAYLRDTGQRPRNVQQLAPTPDHPMVGVEWYDAILYCRWLTEQAGMGETDQCYNDQREWQPIGRDFFANVEFHPERPGFRLPTETEWEYACRSGTTTAYSFGTDRTLLGHYAWFEENSRGQTQLPARLRPNPRGLFDMHGNVYEWCQDPYSVNLEAEGPAARVNQRRVLHGGAWGFDARQCRSAYRHPDFPNMPLPTYGFRVARTLGSVAPGP